MTVFVVLAVLALVAGLVLLVLAYREGADDDDVEYVYVHVEGPARPRR